MKTEFVSGETQVPEYIGTAIFISSPNVLAHIHNNVFLDEIFQINV